LERQRRLTQWDLKPAGYENITAEQAKLSGMFPLPGAPRQQPMDPQRLQALVNQPQNVAATSALKPTMARQSKRLLVYNVPASVTEEDLVNFFNLQLNGVNIIKSVDPCQAAHISANARSHALLEFKNPNDATVALALDGISMADDSMETSDGTANGSVGLSIKRPKDYIGPPAAPPAEVAEGQISNDVPDSTEKILITNLAPFLDEEQITQLLVAIGPLKALVLAVDDSQQSRVSSPSSLSTRTNLILGLCLLRIREP
jgi:splicing factor U2AF subunit